MLEAKLFGNAYVEYNSFVDLKKIKSRMDVLFEVQYCFGGLAADSNVTNLWGGGTCRNKCAACLSLLFLQNFFG